MAPVPNQPGRGPRRVVLIVAGTIAALLVLVVAGIFVIHRIQGPSKPPLTLNASTGSATTAPTGSTNPAGPSSGSVEGTWKVTSGSQAGYRIKETLFGQSATAVGRTSSVSGTIAIAGTDVSSGSFSVDLTTITSGRTQRDSQFQGRIMDTASFPTATFKLTQPIHIGSLPADGATVSEQATGDLTMHGTTRSVTFGVAAKRSGTAIQVNGSIPVIFADYNIANPSGGPATTEDHGTMEFLLNFTHA